MPPILALFISAVFAYFAFRSDRHRDIGDTQGLFWPSLWYVVVATRPIGYWLDLWGVPLPGGSDDPTDGSLIDRSFFALLTVIGLRILARRGFNWGEVFRRNPLLTALCAYMAASILWSHYPYVSFKRYIKVVGSIVMAMVVLSKERPLDAIFTVLRRCLYIHLPMSIVCTRYYRDIGVTFDWGGTAEWWNGISTTKNTLGQISMLGVIYFFWEVRRHWSEFKWRNLHMLYLLMAIYLLKGGPGGFSMTSISVCAFAIFVFLRIQSLRNRTSAVRPFFMGVFGGLVVFISFVLIHSVVMFSPESIFGRLITLFGRDITLTDRTFIWSDVYAAASHSPLVGVGFGGFWIGRLVNIPWNAHMTWVLGQAHSGYVDVYLQLGILGAMLFAAVMFATPSRLLASLEENFEFGCFRITMFLTIVYVNITESSYLRGDHHLWLIMQMVMWTVPTPPSALENVNAREENPSSPLQLDAAVSSFDSAAAIPVTNHYDPLPSDREEPSSPTSP